MFSIFSNKPNTELEKENEKINSEKNDSNKGISLELGDVIQIVDPTNEIYNSTFFIDYLDSNKIVLIDTNTYKKVELYKNEDGTLTNNTIQEVQLLYRNDKKGYAQQNGLTTGKWINLYFKGDPGLNNDVPEIITGEITNLEEDMIEVKKYPTSEVFYINFDYQGLPQDIPLERIELRNTPEKPKLSVQEPEPAEIEEENLEERKLGELGELEEGLELREGETVESEKGIILSLPKPEKEKKAYDKHTIQYVLNADAIQFQDLVEQVVQFTNVDEKSRRYGLEDQLNDMLNDILSTIPTQSRSDTVMQNIHKMIERYSQLRKIYSTFDEYDNIQGMKTVGSNNKPLSEYFEKMDKTLYWLLPVVETNPDMFYDIFNNNESDLREHLETMEKIYKDYKNNVNNTDNNYYDYVTRIDNNTNFIRNIGFNPEDPVIQKQVRTDMLGVFNNPQNNGNFYTIAIHKQTRNRVRFYTEKYLTGFTKLVAMNTSSNPRSKEIYTREPLTNSETMNIRAFLTLPEPTVRFSKINLPNTSIMDKANLGLHFLNYWQALKKTTVVNNIFVDDDYNNTDDSTEDSEFISNEYKQYIIQLENNGVSLDSQYKQFINKVVPSSKGLLSSLKKYIQGKMSIVDVVGYLESFMVYTDGLTYQQFKQITQLILNPMINEYNINFDKNASLFSMLNNKLKSIYKNTNSSNTSQNVKKNLIQVLQYSYEPKIDFSEIVKVYDIAPYDTDGEVLTNFSEVDYGLLYYYSIALKSSPLMFSEQLNLLLQEKTQIETDLNEEKAKPKTCKDIVIAKSYISLSQLEKDNGRELYFDSRFDKTNYGLIDEYTNERSKMSSDEFVIFLKDKLSFKLKISDSEAQYLTDTLIRGKKQVKNGQYAVVNDLEQNTYSYYIRENNQWNVDKTIKGDIHDLDADDSNLLCNIQDKCASITTFANENKPYVPSLGSSKEPGTNSENSNTQCITTTANDLIMKQSLIQEIVDEFDERYAVSKEEHERDLKEKYEYALKTADVLKKIWVKKQLRSNFQKYTLGLKVEDGVSIVLSPYAPLLNKILGQSDMVKKQHDILKFKNKFTRQAIGEEATYYLYCIKTGSKLLPVSLYQMAYQYVNNYDGYPAFVELLIAKIGVEYEDRIVDEHTGVTLKMSEYNDDEGYENGFRVVTRDVMKDNTIVLDDNGNVIDADVNQTDILKDTTGDIGIGGLEELGQYMNYDKVVKKYTSPEDKMILNIVRVLQADMHIDRVAEDFILNNVISIISQVLYSKAEYDELVKEQMKKSSKKPIDYNDLRNKHFLYYTVAMFLISIQLSFPPVPVKRTFYGCKKISSFDDYPLHPDGNKEENSSLEYITCVVSNIRSSVEPWNIISKKEKDIKKEIVFAIENILTIPDVQRRIQEKLNYLKNMSEKKKNSAIDISEKDDVTKWTQFLPPLVNFKIKRLENISSSFHTELLRDLRDGFNSQQEKILVVQSKIKAFSLLLQEKIHTIIQKKELLLRNRNSSVLYIENACCNELGEKNTILYFNKEDPSILNTNELVVQLVNIMRDVEFLSNAKRLQCTKIVNIPFPKILDDFDEETIYLAFIHYCHFKTLQPIPKELLPYCGVKIEGESGDERGQGKPSFIKPTDNNVEIIANMKSNNVKYEKNDFLRMLQLVHKNLIISNETSRYDSRQRVDPLESFKEFLVTLLNEGYDTSMVQLFISYLNSDANHLDDNADNFMNYLAEQNNQNIEMLNKFFKDKDKKMIKNFKDLMKWNGMGQNDVDKNNILFQTQTVIPFFKTLIQNFASSFPNMIIRKVSYKKVTMGKHMGLSNIHLKDISSIITTYYECLTSFYDKKNYPMLEMIQMTTHNILLLSQETPALDPSICTLLYEYYFLKIMTEYVNLVRNMKPTLPEEVVSNFDIKTGNIVMFRSKVADLLLAFIDCMNSHKKLIDITYEDIAEQMFRVREKEKDKIRKRLTQLSDEERQADNAMKAVKLGVWSKGLQKGLTVYDKNNYDMERREGDEDLEVSEALEEDDVVIDNNLGLEIDGTNGLYDSNNLEDEDYINNEDDFIQNRNDDDDDNYDYDE
jgi:hypothetical protein